jgi:hypothetical protein
MTEMVKGFGCRLAYESLSCRNPRSAHVGLWAFLFGQHRLSHGGGDRLLRACQQPRARLADAGLLQTLDTLRSAVNHRGRGRQRRGSIRSRRPAHARRRSGPCLCHRPRIERHPRPGPSGVHYLAEADPPALARLLARISRDRQPGDIVECSIHLDPNWGYDIDPVDRSLVHWLIEKAAASVGGSGSTTKERWHSRQGGRHSRAGLHRHFVPIAPPFARMTAACTARASLPSRRGRKSFVFYNFINSDHRSC